MRTLHFLEKCAKPLMYLPAFIVFHEILCSCFFNKRAFKYFFNFISLTFSLTRLFHWSPYHIDASREISQSMIYNGKWTFSFSFSLHSKSHALTGVQSTMFHLCGAETVESKVIFLPATVYISTIARTVEIIPNSIKLWWFLP